ncbi:MAG: phosphate ABC transporter permease PstA [Rikenellaceae bacterium]
MKDVNFITKIRQGKDLSFFILVSLLSLFMAVPLFAIILEVLVKGYSQLNFDFFTQTAPTTYEAMMARDAGGVIPGGIVNGILGTIFMVVSSAVLAIPIGIAGGVYLAENANSRIAGVVRFLTELIQGTPSIIVGVIVYAWIVVPFKSYSALAGAVSLAIMMLPLIVRSTEETLKMLPSSLKEAGLALGGSYASVVLKVLLPAAFNGIFTGTLLAISRVIGETAPLMITALGSTMINWDLLSPTSAVSLLIWEFYNDPNLVSLIWSSSLFLLILVLTLNITAKYMVYRSSK